MESSSITSPDPEKRTFNPIPEGQVPPKGKKDLSSVLIVRIVTMEVQETTLQKELNAMVVRKRELEAKMCSYARRINKVKLDRNKCREIINLTAQPRNLPRFFSCQCLSPPQEKSPCQPRMPGISQNQVQFQKHLWFDPSLTTKAQNRWKTMCINHQLQHRTLPPELQRNWFS